MQACDIMCKYNINNKKEFQKWLLKNHPDKGGNISKDEFSEILQCFKNNNFCKTNKDTNKNV